MAHVFQITVQYLCLAFLAALATACALVGLKKVGKCLYTRLSPASLVVLALAAVITICEAQKRGDSGATGDSPAPVQQTGTTGDPPVEDITDTFHFSAISVPTSGTVALTTAWTNGLLTAGQTIDILAKTDLRDERWAWLTNGVVEAGATNMSWTIENQSPSNSFYKAVVRDTLTDMDDPDGDGLPNAYELAHGRNPWVRDYALVQKLTVGPNGDFGDIVSALAESEEYSVIELDATLRHEVTDSLGIRMPQHPVMITATQHYAVVRATGLSAFMLATNTTSRTLFRNLYILLDGSGSSQVGFWCGGNLPDAGVPASATFENIYMRMRNPAAQYRGWLVYRGCADSVTLRRCMLNAAGATWAIGIDAYGSPPLALDRCSFVNFPPDGATGAGCGVLLRTSAASDGGSEVSVSRTLFDESFTNAWPLGRFDAASPYFASFSDCLSPRAFPATYPPDAVANLTVTNAALTWAGIPYPDSPSVALDIGALAPIPGDSLDDADHDTLLDYDEVHVHGTDPWLADSDNDGVSDGVEVSEQTNPNDELNFCFACTVTVSNVDAVFTNSCCSYLIGQEITAPVTSFVGSATVELPHVTVTDGVVPRVVAWIDVNANGIWEVGEPRAIQTLTITNHGLSVSIDLLQVNDDMDGDKMPDVWEVLHGFCPTNSADAFEDPDGDTLPNLFEYRYSTNPHNPLDGSNTVYSILARSVDDRLRAKIDAEGDVRHIYVDFTNTVQSGGDFIPNTDAWTYGLDFASSGVKSIRAVGTENGLTPILISDRHVMEATHCDHRTNDVVWFRAPGGTMYERTIVGMKHCQNSANDVSIGILNEPLPNDVIPVKFLPENYRQYIWDGERLPTIRVNKYSQAVVQEISRIPPANVTSYSMTIPEVQYRISDDVPRESFRVDTLWGDSGHPNFLVAGNAMIFLFPTHNTPLGNPFCGMSCLSICLKSEIETMMNDLCGEHGITNHYSVQQFDFSLLVSD
ncbi:MAG: hypothetical protein IJL17_17215 [Kiritimatiellae bacterium]|nr:hypothetical protein [Kiritimatiellia bacterium]